MRLIFCMTLIRKETFSSILSLTTAMHPSGPYVLQNINTVYYIICTGEILHPETLQWNQVIMSGERGSLCRRPMLRCEEYWASLPITSRLDVGKEASKKDGECSPTRTDSWSNNWVPLDTVSTRKWGVKLKREKDRNVGIVVDWDLRTKLVKIEKIV